MQIVSFRGILEKLEESTKISVSFSEGRGKFFYIIKKNLITIIDENENVVVYGDVNDECVICMEENNQIVFIP